MNNWATLEFNWGERFKSIIPVSDSLKNMMKAIDTNMLHFVITFSSTQWPSNSFGTHDAIPQREPALQHIEVTVETLR